MTQCLHCGAAPPVPATHCPSCGQLLHVTPRQSSPIAPTRIVATGTGPAHAATAAPQHPPAAAQAHTQMLTPGSGPDPNKATLMGLPPQAFPGAFPPAAATPGVPMQPMPGPPAVPSAAAPPPRVDVGSQTQMGYRPIAPAVPAVGARTIVGHRAPDSLAPPLPRSSSSPAPPPSPLRPEPLRAAPPAAPPQRPAPAGPHPRVEAQRRRREQDPLLRRGVFPAMAAPPRKKSDARLSHWLLGGTLLLLSFALVVVLVVGMSKQLRADVVRDRGEEALELVCERCEDGTKVTVQGTRSQFQNNVARLKLTAPLPIGMNKVRVELPEGGWFGSETFEVDVPMHFRIQALTQELYGLAPKLPIQIEAEDGASARVDGAAVDFDNGKGRVELDVADALTGAAEKVESVERTIVYTVKPAHARTHSGRIQINFSVTPLVVEAPGPRVVIQETSFTLAGRTLPGAELKLDGAPLPLDERGRFAQRLNVDTVGSTTIWLTSSMEGHATRRFPIQVKRVTSLHEEAQRFAEDASQNYERFADDPETQRGLAVALEGRVRKVWKAGNSTKALFQVTSGCTGTCLAELVHGGPVQLSERARVTAYGHVDGSTTTTDGKPIPRIRTLFVLTSRSR